MMKAIQGDRRIAFLAFFLSHIFFTCACDLQAILKPWYPQVMQDGIQGYARLVSDPLMKAPFELWFQAFVFAEMIFQLPYFFVTVHMLWDAKRETYPQWFQMISIVYGTHVTTTLIPMFPTIWYPEEETPVAKRLAVIFLYFPYFIFPAWIGWIAATDSGADFGQGGGKVKQAVFFYLMVFLLFTAWLVKTVFFADAVDGGTQQEL